MVLRSVPCSSKWVANEWRSMCTCTRCLIPAWLAASFSIFTSALCRIRFSGCLSLEQPFLRTVLLEIFPQFLQQFFRQQRIPAFPSFAHDAYKHPFAYDVLGGEVQQLARRSPAEYINEIMQRCFRFDRHERIRHTSLRLSTSGRLLYSLARVMPP